MTKIAILIFTKYHQAKQNVKKQRMGSSSIGIIGGADGPTKIIISGNPLLEIIAVAVIAVIIVGVVVFFIKSK